MNSLRYLNFCLLLVMTTSCAPSILKGLHKEGNGMVKKEELMLPQVASGGLQRFNMTFDLMKHHFSGILLIKEMEKANYRILFTTH
ncbi:hypothetical protein LJC38_07460, partial [Parabacteroides sp. OttesenSCG-928-K15]|nr:hypothetical protein [Parabacteroides sp. OttesenSCG-928-K15]